MRIASQLPLLFLALTTACYETPTPECAFSCGPDDACPDGYSCRPDTWCKRNDVTDEFECPTPLPDASSPPSDASSGTGDAVIRAALPPPAAAGAMSPAPSLFRSPEPSGS